MKETLDRDLYRFDFAISFAGTDRSIAEELRDNLRDAGCSVFYDRDFEHEMLGLDGASYLRDVYTRQSRFCVILISAAYDQRDWTQLEREAIQSRELSGQSGVLLPVITDGHQADWLPATRIYFDLSSRTLADLVKLLLQRPGLSKTTLNKPGAAGIVVGLPAISRADVVRTIAHGSILKIESGQVISIPAVGPFSRRRYVFNGVAIDAVNAALAAGRPLLAEGERGPELDVLASACSAALGRTYVQVRVSPRTEASELLWTIDRERRSVEAQIAGTQPLDRSELSGLLATNRFLQPGPVWWALDWESAQNQAALVGIGGPPVPPAWQPSNGVVLHLDAIDRASDHCLLEIMDVFQLGSFRVPDSGDSVSMTGTPPLVVMTSAAMKDLPQDLVRHCVVLRIQLPEANDQMVAYLSMQGRAHFPEASEELLDHAARLTIEDRQYALRAQNGIVPGVNEYLDLVRAVLSMTSQEPEQLELLARTAQFVLRKEQ